MEFQKLKRRMRSKMLNQREAIALERQVYKDAYQRLSGEDQNNLDMVIKHLRNRVIRYNRVPGRKSSEFGVNSALELLVALIPYLDGACEGKECPHGKI